MAWGQLRVHLGIAEGNVPGIDFLQCSLAFCPYWHVFMPS